MIAVIGNSGVGKTTLARLLADRLGLPMAAEQHTERPFQRGCAEDPHRYAFANQVDYLLFRAEQEADLRDRFGRGVIDGGLDLDFHGFTRLFHRKGYLSNSELEVCRRLYEHLRHLQPPPEVFVHVTAPPPRIEERFDRRRRATEVTRREDLPLLGSLIDEWLSELQASPVIELDASIEDASYEQVLPGLLEQLRPSTPTDSSGR